MSLEINPLAQPCRNLRSKEMFHDPNPLLEDDFSSGQYWCLKTQQLIGPDGKLVNRLECSPGRSCFCD